MEAVGLCERGDRTIREVAKSIGVHEVQLSRWKKQLGSKGTEAFPGQGKRGGLEEENWRLKLENKRLKEEMDFLKKVSRYFAKEGE